MTKIVLQMMGMNCYKCHIPMGAICIPSDSDETPESMMAFLIKKRLLPMCEKCIMANPMFTSAANLRKEI
jgi:hypothetical protein